MRSIRQQLTYAVRTNTAFGQSKHAEKGKGLGMQSVMHDGRSYSYCTFNARLDTAKQFSHWIATNYPDITMAREITADHANEFLLDKAKTCRNATLESYASNLRALAKEINTTYKGSRMDCNGIKTIVNDTTASRTVAMARDDFRALKDSFKADSLGHRALCLEDATGARVEGLTKLTPGDITIISDTRANVYIHGEKGGRNRTVEVYGAKHVQELQHIKDIIPSDQRICGVKPDSLNKSFNRHLHKLGLKEKYSLTSVHSMRKAWAQKTYDRYRATHTKLESVKYVNVQLGHGADRDQVLLDRYVADCH